MELNANKIIFFLDSRIFIALAIMILFSFRFDIFFLISSWQRFFSYDPSVLIWFIIIDLSRMIHCLSCDTMFLNPFEFRFGKILSKDIQFKLTLSF